MKISVYIDSRVSISEHCIDRGFCNLNLCLTELVTCFLFILSSIVLFLLEKL